MRISDYEKSHITNQVIKEFAKICIAQDEKGHKRYGKLLDDTNDDDYNWQLMALEESADLIKYMVRENMKLKKENERLKKIISEMELLT